MAQLICRDLSAGYEGREIVGNITFEVNAGEYLCIVGENGAGKTTLMRTILGLQPALRGTIETGDGVGRTGIGYLPQQTAVQKDFPASVREIVLSGRQGKRGIRPFYSAEDKRAARQALEQMGIVHLADRCYRELSGGQQQRVLLARALAAADRMLLLDEPVTGLDPKAAEEMYGLIASLNASGMTIIMITHDMRAAAEYATHLLRVEKGTAVKEANRCA